MTDLIKTLRGQLGPVPIPSYSEIADELERLTAELAESGERAKVCQAQADDRAQDCFRLIEEKERLTAELEALKQDNSSLLSSLTGECNARIALEDELEAAKRDSDRLDFLIEQDARVAFSRDHDVCHVGRYEDADGDLEWVRLGPTLDQPRQAIDAAIAALSASSDGAAKGGS